MSNNIIRTHFSPFSPTRITNKNTIVPAHLPDSTAPILTSVPLATQLKEKPPNSHNHNLKVPKHNLAGRFPSLASLPKENREKIKYWSDIALVGLTVLNSQGLARGLAPSVLHNAYEHASGAVEEQIDSHTAQSPTQPKNAPPLKNNKLMKQIGLTTQQVNELKKEAREASNL